jgi:hypothetical protein
MVLTPELSGLQFASRPAFNQSAVTISASEGATVYILVSSDHGKDATDKGVPVLRQGLLNSGWTRVLPDSQRDPPTRFLAVYRQTFATATQLTIPGAGGSDTIVASANLSLAQAVTAKAKASSKDTPLQPDDQALPGEQPATSSNPDHISVRAIPNNMPMAGPTTRVVSQQATINILSVLSESGNDVAGQTTEFILTVTPGDSSRLVTVHYVTPIGDQMAAVTDDVLRYIHLKYPNWYADKAEFTFGDRADYDGPSIGAAIGTLICSVIEGFTIDPNAAITGDIAANGAVHAIGGLSYKLRSATAAGYAIVAVPTKNYDNLVDAVIYNSTSVVTGVQVIGISNLDDAVAVMRTDRDEKLTPAIALFAKVQQALKDDPHALQNGAVQSELREILSLEPNHLSAKLLLMVAENKQPPALSPTASLYYTNMAVNVMLPILKDRANFDSTHQITSSAVQQQLADLNKLRPIADGKIQPLIDAWVRLLRTWSALEAGGGSPAGMDALIQKLTDEIAIVNADPDLNQKLLTEGM